MWTTQTLEATTVITLAYLPVPAMVSTFSRGASAVVRAVNVAVQNIKSKMNTIRWKKGVDGGFFPENLSLD